MDNTLAIASDFINHNFEVVIVLFGLAILTGFIFLYWKMKQNTARIDHLDHLHHRSSDAAPPLQSISEEKTKLFGVFKRRVNKTKFYEPQKFNGFSQIPGRLGVVCDHCEYVTANIKDMQKHVSIHYSIHYTTHGGYWATCLHLRVTWYRLKAPWSLALQAPATFWLCMT